MSCDAGGVACEELLSSDRECVCLFFFFQAEDGIRDYKVTGVQTCALPIFEERSSVLMRTADDDDTTAEGRLERVVVANADQLVIVSALADPPPRTGFIDRCLVAAYDAEIDPLLCLTKADLAGPEAVLDYYADLDLPHVLTRPDGDLGPLIAELSGRISVLVGHSGVGKSTLVNRLVPDADRRGRGGRGVGQGRHTSAHGGAVPPPHPDALGPRHPGTP